MKQVNGYFDDLQFTIRGLDIFVSGTCTGHDDDQGIGAYEYWGAKYVDNQWVTVQDEWSPAYFTIDLNATVSSTESGKYIAEPSPQTVELTAAEFKSKYPNIFSALEDQFFELTEGIIWEETDEDDYFEFEP